MGQIGIQIARLLARLMNRKITLSVDSDARAWLAEEDMILSLGAAAETCDPTRCRIHWRK